MSPNFLQCPQCGKKEKIVKSCIISCSKCGHVFGTRCWGLKMGDVLKRGRLYKTKKDLRFYTSPKDFNIKRSIFKEGVLLLYVGYETNRKKTSRKVKFITPDGMVRYGLYNPAINSPIRLGELFEEVETL